MFKKASSMFKKLNKDRYDVLAENGNKHLNISYNYAKKLLKDYDKKGIGACMKYVGEQN